MATVTAKVYGSLEEAVKASLESNHFYVVNMSDRQGKQPKGQLIAKVVSDDGSHSTIIVPPTWVPLDLIRFAPPELLKKCTDLRNYHRDGMLVFLAEESAEILKKEPGYAAEFRKSTEKISALANATELSTSVTINTASSVARTASVQKDDEVPANLGGERVVRLVTAYTRFNKTEIELSELQDLIRIEFPQMELADFEALSTQIGDRSSFMYLATTDAMGLILNGEAVDYENLPVVIEAA